MRGEKNNKKIVVSYSLSPPDLAFMCVFKRGTGLCWLAVMPRRADGGLDGQGKGFPAGMGLDPPGGPVAAKSSQKGAERGSCPVLGGQS